MSRRRKSPTVARLKDSHHVPRPEEPHCDGLERPEPRSAKPNKLFLGIMTAILVLWIAALVVLAVLRL
jgi:hypothetical protein